MDQQAITGQIDSRAIEASGLLVLIGRHAEEVKEDNLSEGVAKTFRLPEKQALDEIAALVGADCWRLQVNGVVLFDTNCWYEELGRSFSSVQAKNHKKYNAEQELRMRLLTDRVFREKTLAGSLAVAVFLGNDPAFEIDTYTRLPSGKYLHVCARAETPAAHFQ